MADSDADSAYTRVTFDDVGQGFFQDWYFMVARSTQGSGFYQFTFNISGDQGNSENYFVEVDEVAQVLCNWAMDHGWRVDALTNESKQFVDLSGMLPEGQAPTRLPDVNVWND